MRRSTIALLVLCAATTAQAATTYRMTITRTDRFKRPPEVQQVVIDSEKRRLTVEHPEEPFGYDVLLSADGGRTVTALNTGLHTWFDLGKFSPSGFPGIGRSPGATAEISKATITVTEEPGQEPIAGFPVRKLVVRAGYTTREDYGGTKVNRVHTMTMLLWTTDKLDRSLAFSIPAFATGVESLDADPRLKSAVSSGFPLRSVMTVSRAYEGGEPVVEMTKVEVDDIRPAAPPPASAFVKPAGYVNQEPVIGGFKKQ
jgi:hypothetical protein